MPNLPPQSERTIVTSDFRAYKVTDGLFRRCAALQVPDNDNDSDSDRGPRMLPKSEAKVKRCDGQRIATDVDEL